MQDGGGEIGTRSRITDIFVGQYNTDISVTLPIQQHDHTYVYNATYIILLL